MKFQKLLFSLLIISLFSSNIYTAQTMPWQMKSVNAEKLEDDLDELKKAGKKIDPDIIDGSFWTPAHIETLNPMAKAQLGRNWTLEQQQDQKNKILATEAAATPKPAQAVGKLNIPAGLGSGIQTPATGAPTPKGPPPPPPVAKGPPPLPGGIPAPKAKLPPPPPPAAKSQPPLSSNAPEPKNTTPLAPIANLRPVQPVTKITPPVNPQSAMMEELKLRQARQEAAKAQVTADQAQLSADAAQLQVDRDRLQAAKTTTPAAKIKNLELELKIAKEQEKVEAERVKLLQDQAKAQQFAIAAKAAPLPTPTIALAVKQAAAKTTPPQDPPLTRTILTPPPADQEETKPKLEKIILVIRCIKNTIDRA